VVVVPRDAAAEVLERLRQRSAAEAEYVAAVSRGEFSNAWVDGILSDAGVPVERPDDS
jgi:regulator of RNase E activity RraA